MTKSGRFCFRVTYEIPPTRAIHTAEFAEFAASTDKIEAMVQAENPRWRIKKIERGLVMDAISPPTKG